MHESTQVFNDLDVQDDKLMLDLAVFLNRLVREGLRAVGYRIGMERPLKVSKEFVGGTRSEQRSFATTGIVLRPFDLLRCGK